MKIAKPLMGGGLSMPRGWVSKIALNNDSGTASRRECWEAIFDAETAPTVDWKRILERLRIVFDLREAQVMKTAREVLVEIARPLAERTREMKLNALWEASAERGKREF